MVSKELQIDGAANRTEGTEGGNARKDRRAIAVAGWGH